MYVHKYMHKVFHVKHCTYTGKINNSPKVKSSGQECPLYSGRSGRVAAPVGYLF
jgi:hypothetical protein